MATGSRLLVKSSVSRGKHQNLDFYVTTPEQMKKTQIKGFEQSSNKTKLVYTYAAPSGILSVANVTIIWSPNETKFAISFRLDGKPRVVVCEFDHAEKLLEVEGNFDSWVDDNNSVIVKDAKGTHVHEVIRYSAEAAWAQFHEYNRERYGSGYDSYYDGRRTSAGIPSLAEPFIPPPGYPGWR